MNNPVGEGMNTQNGYKKYYFRMSIHYKSDIIIITTLSFSTFCFPTS